jgi:hypothetical protein
MLTEIAKIKSNYLAWVGKFGSIFFTNPHVNDMIQYDASLDMHPNFAKSPKFPRSIGLISFL